MKVSRLLVLCIFLLLVLVAIFAFSSQSGEQSNELSFKVTDKVIDRLADFGVIPKASELTSDERKLANLTIRKIAHCLLYCSLAFVGYLCLYSFSRRPWWSFFSVLMVVFLIACTDEWRQNFTGRDGNLFDVGIDMLGAFVGAILGCVLSGIIRRKR